MSEIRRELSPFILLKRPKNRLAIKVDLKRGKNLAQNRLTLLPLRQVPAKHLISIAISS